MSRWRGCYTNRRSPRRSSARAPWTNSPAARARLRSSSARTTSRRLTRSGPAPAARHPKRTRGRLSATKVTTVQQKAAVCSALTSPLLFCCSWLFLLRFASTNRRVFLGAAARAFDLSGGLRGDVLTLAAFFAQHSERQQPYPDHDTHIRYVEHREVAHVQEVDHREIKPHAVDHVAQRAAQLQAERGADQPRPARKLPVEVEDHQHNDSGDQQEDLPTSGEHPEGRAAVADVRK